MRWSGVDRFNFAELNRKMRSTINIREPLIRQGFSRSSRLLSYPIRALHEANFESISYNRRNIGILLLSSGAFITIATPAWAEANKQSGDWSSPGLNAPLDPSIPQFFKTASGVKVQELLIGENGEEAQEGDLVLLDFVLRRSNGYFIYSTIEGVSFQPKDTPVGPIAVRLGDPSLIPGLGNAIKGMRKGGKRRALIPPSAGYATDGKSCEESLQPQMPTFSTKRQLFSHCTEPLLFEIELLRVTKKG